MARPTNDESRAEEIRRNRRWKPGTIGDSDLKLTTTLTEQDKKDHQYRWVNDTPGRVQRMHSRDWDVVQHSVKEDSNSLGTQNSVNGGVGEEGKPYNMILMRKHKVLFEDDQVRKMRPLDDLEKNIRRGMTGLPGQELAGEGVYTPDAGNRIETFKR